MKKLAKIIPLLMLGACVYGSPVNYEKFYGNSDITKVDWSRVDGRGSACQTNWFFGLLPFGDNSVPTAIERAELAKVSYIDTDTVFYLPLLMTRDCTNVWGELTPAAREAQRYNEDFDDEFDEEDIPVKKPAAVTPKIQPKAAAAKSTEAKAAAEINTAAKSDYEMPKP